MNTTTMTAPRADGLMPFDQQTLLRRRDVEKMVLREVGMNDRAKADLIGSDDRIMQNFFQAYRAICHSFWKGGEMGLTDWAIKASECDILAFGQAVENLFPNPKELSGFRIVRGTNLSDGFPVCYFEGVFKAG